MKVKLGFSENDENADATDFGTPEDSGLCHPLCQCPKCIGKQRVSLWLVRYRSCASLLPLRSFAEEEIIHCYGGASVKDWKLSPQNDIIVPPQKHIYINIIAVSNYPR